MGRSHAGHQGKARRSWTWVKTRTYLVVAASIAALLVPGSASPAAAASSFEKGVNISFYDNDARSDEFVRTQASLYAQYFATELGATTVTVTVPLWVTSPHANKVLSGLDPVTHYSSTPSPERLRILIDALRAQGLEVRVRPLINEGALRLDGSWRGKLNPTNRDRWFDSYKQAIAPMVAEAAIGGASSFVIQVELQKLGDDPRWAGLISWVHDQFAGNVVWNSVWGLKAGAGYAPHPRTHFAIDPYPIVHLPGKASASQLAEGWASFLDANPLPAPASTTLLHEVGILASSNVYSQPWLHSNPGGRFSPRTQARWFKAACSFAHRFGFRGLSFNSFFLTSPILRSDDPSHPQLIQPDGAAAIATCFGRS